MGLYGYITIAALCIILLASLLILYDRFFAKDLKPKTGELSAIVKKIMELPPCSMGNMESISSFFANAHNTALKKAFFYYQSDTMHLLRTEIAPEASGYFKYEGVYSIPRADYYRGVFQTISIAAAILLAAIPPVWTLLIGPFYGGGAYALPLSFGVSLFCLLWVFVLHLFFQMLTGKAQLESILALEAVEPALRYALPTAGKETQAALLLDGVRHAKESFAESADLIAVKIDSFAVNVLMPAASEAFEHAIESHIKPVFTSMDMTLSSLSAAILEKQEQGLRALAENISEQLYGAISDKMMDLGSITEKLSRDLTEMTENLTEVTGRISLGLEEDQKTLHEITGMSARSAEAQQRLADGMFAFSQHLGEAKVLTASMREQAEQILAATKQTAQQSALVSSEQRELLTKSRAELSEAHSALGATLTDANKALQGTLTEIGDTLRSALSESSEQFALYGAHLEKNLAAAMDTVRSAGEQSRGLVAEQIAALDKSLTAAMETVREANEQSRGLMMEQINVGGAHMESIAGSIMNAVTRQEAVMNENLEKLASGVSGSLQKAMESNADTAERLGKTVEMLANAGTEQYEKAAQSAASLLENIVKEINKAMANVGREISDSIIKATGESAEIVTRLTEQTAHLKQEYDTYFTRVEEQNRNNYEDLDYHMQNITARFVEETKIVITTLQESISGAMGLFEGNTATLLSNLDEQSRSIGLYAKELAYDITSLSASLKESVAEFSGHLHEGVVRTFDDFDAGLSDVSKRLANTIESIRDSVENLPLALSDPDKLRQ